MWLGGTRQVKIGCSYWGVAQFGRALALKTIPNKKLLPILFILYIYFLLINDEVLGSLVTPPVLGTGELVSSNLTTSTMEKKYRGE